MSTETQDLRRKIAEALGWRLTIEDDRYRLRQPDGTRHGFDTRYGWSEWWQPVGIEPESKIAEYAFSCCPNWPEDVAAALSLIPQKATLTLTGPYGDEWCAQIDYGKTFSASPALAICRAWLAWKESQHGD
jgi:hypothetical protein